jgi:hypothetical protein
MNNSLAQINLTSSYVLLQSPFDPTNSLGIPLPAGEDFRWTSLSGSFTSDIRKPFNFLLAGRYGGYYNGTAWTVNNELNFRVQPYGSLGIISSYNNIKLPYPYSSAGFILVGPRLDLTFTNTLFFTSLVQYNDQIDNINLNLRFQWRFAPVSDLFIVYTENSFPQDHRIKNRGLVLKVSYWFN